MTRFACLALVVRAGFGLIYRRLARCDFSMILERRKILYKHAHCSFAPTLNNILRNCHGNTFK
jgi:hypothetical protein